MFLRREDGDNAADGFEEASKAGALDARVQLVQRVTTFLFHTVLFCCGRSVLSV